MKDEMPKLTVGQRFDALASRAQQKSPELDPLDAKLILAAHTSFSTASQTQQGLNLDLAVLRKEAAEQMSKSPKSQEKLTSGQKLDAMIAFIQKYPDHLDAKLIWAIRDSCATYKADSAIVSFDLTRVRENAHMPRGKCSQKKKYAALACAVIGYGVLRGAEWVIRRK